LRQAVHDIQDCLSHIGPNPLRAERHHLSLNDAIVAIDVTDALRQAAPGPDTLALFRTPLLEDLVGLDRAFDRWLADERARIVGIVCARADRMLDSLPMGGDVLDIAERLVAIEPDHERAWRAIMAAHHHRGDRASALAAFDRCRAALTTAGRSTPSPDTEALATRIRVEPDRAPLPADAVATAPSPLSWPQGSGSDERPRASLRLGIAPLRVIGTAPLDELSLGLAEEITTTLSRVRWITCVSGASWMALSGGTPSDPLWSSADVDLLLDGTIQQTGERIRISVRLVDLRAGGAVIWAHRFDRVDADPLTLQDEIGSAIVARLDPALLMHEGERTAARNLPNPTARELVLQALPAIYRLERTGFFNAGKLLHAALAADPTNAAAHAWYAYWHLFLVGQGWAESPAEAAARGGEMSEQAVTLDPTDARSLTLAGHVRSFLGKRPVDGSVLHERAIALNPNLALAWCFSGLTQSYMGNHDEALKRMYQAVRLSPSDPHLFFFEHALIMPHLMLGEYDSAAEIGRRAIELNPWFSSAYKGHLSALGHLGREVEIAAVRARLLDLEPGFTVESAVSRSPLVRHDDLDRYAEGLRRAGLPEKRSG
jgi:TolB-like protein/tetratricopeptide (TPR) repeat protein